MSARTGIEWTQATWNPWMGCDKVSPGCAHCYMFREQHQYGQDPTVVRRSKTKFADPLRWREPLLVFTCSWSDWFHEGADAWRDEAWDIIRRTPQHTYQILTKRPERIAAHLPADWGEGYPNVWLGVSVENQRFAHRAALLCDVPARVRFISAEPLLGPVEFDALLKVCKYWRAEDSLSTRPWHPPYPKHSYKAQALVLAGWSCPIHWVIVGGESGPNARPMELDWARSLRDQCQAAGVAFFLKQLGGWPNKRGGDEAVLDGRTWHEMPATAGACA